MILLFKMLLAHLIGDFFLQPESWVVEKERKKLKSLKLYYHIAIHTALLFLVIWDLSKWPMILIVSGSHFIIDAIKLLFQNQQNKRRLFFIDQVAHIMVIFTVYFSFTEASFELDTIYNPVSLLMVSCLLFLTVPVSIIMRTIFTKWNIDELTQGNESLKDAGKYIGILERLLVFIFIITGHWEAVGFLITAKSVFRFGDLKESKHRKLTEYILIGTLISFGIAITTALIYQAVYSIL